MLGLIEGDRDGLIEAEGDWLGDIDGLILGLILEESDGEIEAEGL